MWDGARNLMDLGGLPVRGGGTTAQGRVWRSAAPESITGPGWAAARAAGLTTVVDLRNDVERADVRDVDGVRIVHAPTEDPDDPDFLAECGPWLDHPRSWAPNLARYPEKFAAVFTAIADAEGGVLVHCAGGRDRTGLVASMLLGLAGVEDEAVADHYEQGFRGAADHRGHGLGYDPVSGEWVAAPDEAWEPDALDAALADRRPVLLGWLRDTDVAAYLGDAGVDAPRLARLRGLVLGQ
ncbi:tyrosine-protein phosphatase [Nocardioides aquiterrae]|uniref:Tyrosine-protein phosphatase n=1 Tax=Nocardioides aquiterrae TaxID=203799 RepID=A0ABN1UB10_9ACTN